MESVDVLFLDFDEVLNTQHHVNIVHNLNKFNTMNDVLKHPNWSDYLMLDKVDILNHAMDAMPHVIIVVHSSWGKFKTLEEIKTALELAGFKHIDKIHSLTPKKMSSSKVHEIMFSLADFKDDENKEVRRYLILDDDYVGEETIFQQFPQKHLKITPQDYIGLTEQQAEEMIRFFTEA